VTGPLNVRIGCSGWVYKDWRGDFYPEKLPQREWLSHYAGTFDTVEVNNTFYRLPTEQAVRGWVEQTPDGFAYAVKASRYLTHIKRLKDLAKYGKTRLFNVLAPMIEANKLAVILWQLPPNYQRNDERLESALAALEDGCRHAFEFRHPSWFCEDVYAMLRERNVALVMADDPKMPFQDHRQHTADWIYIRFHRGSRGRDGNYAPTEIETWARRIAQWRRRRDVYAYFNNDWNGHAFRNAQALKRKLGA
jgi:uncharacterized protein YecE (DUF72 family)